MENQSTKYEKRVLNEKQVVGKMIACIIYAINEEKLLMYRFLASITKNTKKWSCSIELNCDQLTSRTCCIKYIAGDRWTSIKKTFSLIKRSLSLDEECNLFRRAK